MTQKRSNNVDNIVIDIYRDDSVDIYTKDTNNCTAISDISLHNDAKSSESSIIDHNKKYHHLPSKMRAKCDTSVAAKRDIVTNNDIKSSIGTKSSKAIQSFNCQYCKYCTKRKSQYLRHLETSKHKKNVTDYDDHNTDVHYKCECGKTYRHRQGLFTHKKKCTFSPEEEEPSDINTEEVSDQTDDPTNELKCFKQMFTEVMMKFSESIQMQNEVIQSRDEERKRTDELMERMIEKIGNTFNSSNTNNNNFNINMFLNNECKDALNFSDFIDNIQVSRDDLENNARLGFVEGISKIFIDNLSQLTLYERPIHCTDAKRDTLYIKNDNCWNKDTELVKEMMNKSIQAISSKSVQSLIQWKSENEDYNDINSAFSELCLHVHKNSIAGYDRDKFYPKVMKKIASSVPLNKTIIKK